MVFEFQVEKYEIYEKYRESKTFFYGDDIALAVVKLNTKHETYNKNKKTLYPELKCIPKIDFYDQLKEFEKMENEADLTDKSIEINGYPIKIYDKWKKTLTADETDKDLL